MLAADIWYERGWRERALGLLQRASARGADVLIGDIGRAFLPRPLMRELAAYDVPVIAELEDAAVKRVLILTLATSPADQQRRTSGQGTHDQPRPI